MGSPDSGMGDSPPGARRESSDSIDDLPFGDIPTQGSGSQVEELEKNIPVGELIVQNESMTADHEPSEQEKLMKLLEDIQDDSTSAKKPKSSRPRDTHPKARQGVLRTFLNAIKNYVVVILLFIMSVLLKLAGEPTLEK